MRRLRLALFAFAISSAACSANLQAVVFPAEARLGSTVAVVVDSNSIESNETYDRNDISRENLTISIQDAGMNFVEIDPIRAVFQGNAGLQSPYSDARPGAWVTVALFDLPQDLGFTSYDPPPQPEIRIAFDGVEDVTRTTSIQIVGEGGVPQEFYPTPSVNPFLPGAPFELALEPYPTLRIKAIGNAGAFKWKDANDELIPIGAIEMVVDYPAACLSNPRAHAASDAYRATILTQEQVGSVKLLLLDPTGFTLPKTTLLPGGPAHSYRGGGPIIEIAFDRTCAFDVAIDFDIHDLLVSDTLGEVLLDERGQPTSLQHFELYGLADGAP